MKERWISPLAVRFSQGKIHPFFHERGPISEALRLSKGSKIYHLKLKENSSRSHLNSDFYPISNFSTQLYYYHFAI